MLGMGMGKGAGKSIVQGAVQDVGGLRGTSNKSFGYFVRSFRWVIIHKNNEVKLARL